METPTYLKIKIIQLRILYYLRYYLLIYVRDRSQSPFEFGQASGHIFANSGTHNTMLVAFKDNVTRIYGHSKNHRGLE